MHPTCEFNFSRVTRVIRILQLENILSCINLCSPNEFEILINRGPPAHIINNIDKN